MHLVIVVSRFFSESVQIFVDVFRNNDNVHLVASCEFVSHTIMLSTVCIEQVSPSVILLVCQSN